MRRQVFNRQPQINVGRTIPEAFILIYYLDRACEVKLTAQATGQELVLPSPQACERGAREADEGWPGAASASANGLPWCAGGCARPSTAPEIGLKAAGLEPTYLSMIEMLGSRTAKGIAVATIVNLTAAGLNAHQLSADPSKDNPFDTFDLGLTMTSTGSLIDVGQDTITGKVIDVPSPAPVQYLWLIVGEGPAVHDTINGDLTIAPAPDPERRAGFRLTDLSSGSWFGPAT